MAGSLSPPMDRIVPGSFKHLDIILFNTFIRPLTPGYRLEDMTYISCFILFNGRDIRNLPPVRINRHFMQARIATRSTITPQGWLPVTHDSVVKSSFKFTVWRVWHSSLPWVLHLLHHLLLQKLGPLWMGRRCLLLSRDTERTPWPPDTRRALKLDPTSVNVQQSKDRPVLNNQNNNSLIA